MPRTGTPTWPTIDQVRVVLAATYELGNQLDRFQLDTYGLVNREEPTEPEKDAPLPTLADVGALAVLCDDLKEEIASYQRYLHEFESFRDQAAFLVRRNDA